MIALCGEFLCYAMAKRNCRRIMFCQHLVKLITRRIHTLIKYFLCLVFCISVMKNIIDFRLIGKLCSNLIRNIFYALCADILGITALHLTFWQINISRSSFRHIACSCRFN